MSRAWEHTPGNPSTQEFEVGGVQIQGQPGLQSQDLVSKKQVPPPPPRLIIVISKCVGEGGSRQEGSVIWSSGRRGMGEWGWESVGSHSGISKKWGEG